MEAMNPRLAATVSELGETIQRIKRRRESIGEQNTRAILIEPLLAALGWNIRDLNEVRREYRHTPQDNPVDYALFILRSPCLFVEAKDLDTDLEDRRWVSQVLGYATVVGVEWCVLTNGDEYRLYNAHAPVEVEKKLFRCVRISDTSQKAYTLSTLDLLSKANMDEKRIDALWKAHFVDGQVKRALEELFSTATKNLITWIHRQHPELSRPEIRDSLQRADIQIDFPAVPPPVPPSSPRPLTPPRRKAGGVQVKDLIAAGLITPPLALEKTYKGHRLTATIREDGSILFDGRAYASLSTAAGMARKTIIGAPEGRDYPQTNGWTFWRFRDQETGELLEVDVLRQRYLTQFSR